MEKPLLSLVTMTFVGIQDVRDVNSADDYFVLDSDICFGSGGLSRYPVLVSVKCCREADRMIYFVPYSGWVRTDSPLTL